MDSSAKLQTPPLSVHSFCSCDKVTSNHKKEVDFLLVLLGQIVTLQF